MNVNKINKSRRVIKLYRNYCRKLNEERIAGLLKKRTKKMNNIKLYNVNFNNIFVYRFSKYLYIKRSCTLLE